MSANTVVQSMNIRRMYSLFADKSAPTKFAARQRYVEEVVAPPTQIALFSVASQF